MLTYGRIGVLVSLFSLASLAAQSPADYQRLGRDILKELIETDTTHATGSTTVAAERLATRLVAAGFPSSDVMVVRAAGKGAETKGNPVNSASRAAIRSANSGWVLRPVPTAVPPMASA